MFDLKAGIYFEEVVGMRLGIDKELKGAEREVGYLYGLVSWSEQESYEIMVGRRGVHVVPFSEHLQSLLQSICGRVQRLVLVR